MYLSRHIKSHLRKLVFQTLFRGIVELIKRNRGIGAAERDAMALSVKDDVVNVSLRRCEFAGYGPGTGDVCDVASVLLFQRSVEDTDERGREPYSTSVN